MPSTKLQFFSALALFLLLGGTGAAAQDQPDVPVHVDLLRPRIEEMRTRVRSLEAGDLPLGGYHLAKARAWADAAWDVYHLGDRGAVLEETLAEAGDLAGRIEARDAAIPTDTPLLPSSSRLREDLWLQTVRMKSHPGFRCGHATTAQMEVALVMAGHIHAHSGWRHARSYVQAAERLGRQARRQLDECGEAQAAAPATTDQ